MRYLENPAVLALRRSLRRVKFGVVEFLFPGRFYAAHLRNWEAQWSSENYNPGWKTDVVPRELKEAAESGWLGQGSTVLDVGCGSGELAAWLAERGFKVLGVDYSPSAIKQAEMKYGGRKGLEFKVVDVCREPLDANRFAVVVDRGCFHGIPNSFREAYVKNLASCSVPGGRLLLLCATFKHPRLKLCHKRTTERAIIRTVKRSFEPMFEVVRAEKTEMVAGQGDEPPLPGVAFRLARR